MQKTYRNINRLMSAGQLFGRLPLLSQNIILGIMTMVLVGPIYSVTNLLFGSRPGRHLDVYLDSIIPFIPGTIIGYSMIYIFIFIPVFTIKNREIFWRMVFGFFMISVVALPFFLYFPTRIDRPAILNQENFFRWGVAFNYALDQPVNCFPSLHIANGVFAAACCWRVSRIVGFYAIIGIIYIAISTLTLKQHYVLDVIGGAMLGFVAEYLFVRPKVNNLKKREDRVKLIFPPHTALYLVLFYYAGMFLLGILYWSGLRFNV